ncbi:hypothetical protein FEDK69T_16240 [Flavobacterium enshiense DK69]|nr:hypothetical protein FEDK69T_16240 [Flavobacterium enshiense DK69]
MDFERHKDIDLNQVSKRKKGLPNSPDGSGIPSRFFYEMDRTDSGKMVSK